MAALPALIALLASLPVAAQAQAADPPALASSADKNISDADTGRCELRAGQFRLAAQRLEAALAAAPEGLPRARAAAALGEALLSMNRLPEAEARLAQAQEGLVDSAERARVHLALGNLYLMIDRPARAEAAYFSAYQSAVASATADPAMQLSIELNRLRLPGTADRPARLAAVARALASVTDPAARAQIALAAGTQAGQDAGSEALAETLYTAARDSATEAANDMMLAQAYDGLADLQERAHHDAQALRLTERGLWSAQRADARDVLARLEWRAGRVARRQGDDERALAAYRRAVEHVEAIRADIPIRYVDGKSSFRELLGPIYLGLVDLLLQQAGRTQGDAQTALLSRARDSVELIKQTELQDYLRDRCAVDAASHGAGLPVPTGTAIYYPIVLPDRLELLVETSAGLQRVSVAVSAATLQRTVLAFDSALRANRPLQAQAMALHQWLLQPVQGLLAAQAIKTIVAVPDGVLRLVPMAALHDGRDYAVRRYAFATAPGLTLVSQTARATRTRRTLLAGLSEPGPVVDKLPLASLSAMTGTSTAVATADAAPAALRGTLRGALRTLPTSAGGPDAASRSVQLRQALALPGVRDEIEGIGGSLSATTLFDETFTLGELRTRLHDGSYSILHIASHGMFGNSADESFILTYDDLLRLDALQGLLGRQRAGRPGLELISLSACRTAEGDDRAPLGMSGTAIKARAASALGTLWPVADEAAQQVMTRFYALLAQGQLSKAEALRAAQIELIDKADLGHPFFWAPFILAGDWR